MIDYIKRAFYKPNWKLAVRESDKDDSINSLFETNKEYNAFIPDGNFWCADPFIIQEGSLIYVFCEYCRNDSSKGTIAVGEYRNGEIGNMKIIMEQDYHMSYPCVFKYDSVYYMIPETADNKTIELYRARLFPHEWELEKILKKNIRCVDSTVLMIDDEIYIISYILGIKKNKICVFQLNMANETLTLTDEFEDDGTGRPAGSILFIEKRLFRPAQVSKKKYGEGISFKEITSTGDAYCEETFYTLVGKDVRLKGEKKVDRIHTFNRTGNVEIIDYSHDKFEILKPAKLIISKLKQLNLSRSAEVEGK